MNIAALLSATPLASTLGQDAPYGEVATAIAFVGFLLVIIEVTLVRRREALEHDLHIPLDEGQRAGTSSAGVEAHRSAKGGESDGDR